MIDMEHLRTWIGRVEDEQDTITPRLDAEFRVTLQAYLAPLGPKDAPRSIHWCVAPPMAPTQDLGEDGHPAKSGSFMPPILLPRRMWAGGETQFHGELQIGDTVRRRSRIEDIALKEGGSGRLCFVTLRHEYSTQRGIALTERQDIVYREAASALQASVPAPAKPSNAPQADGLVWTVETSPALLFRYSAVTFNGHRIHYDYPYVTGVEHYRGLVVHGPLQASLLINYAAIREGRTPKTVSYRGMAPLFSGTARVRGKAGDNGQLACWTEDDNGNVCMMAKATF